MKKIEGVIFDMDGTLFDTERLSFEFWRKILKGYGYVMNKDVYISLMGRKYEAADMILKERYGEDFPSKEVYEKKNVELIKYIRNNGVPVKIGAYEILDFLVENQYKIALATSTNRKRAMELLEEAEIKDKFNVIVCGDDIVNSKPDPEIFLKAASKLGADPKKCIVLEDSPVGMQAACKGGMMAINVPDLKEPDDEIERLSSKICDNLLEVRDYIRMSELN